MFDPDSLGLNDPTVPAHCRRAWVDYLSDSAAKRHIQGKRPRVWWLPLIPFVAFVVVCLWLWVVL